MRKKVNLKYDDLSILYNFENNCRKTKKTYFKWYYFAGGTCYELN